MTTCQAQFVKLTRDSVKLTMWPIHCVFSSRPEDPAHENPCLFLKIRKNGRWRYNDLSASCLFKNLHDTVTLPYSTMSQKNVLTFLTDEQIGRQIELTFTNMKQRFPSDNKLMPSIFHFEFIFVLKCTALKCAHSAPYEVNDISVCRTPASSHTF